MRHTPLPIRLLLWLHLPPQRAILLLCDALAATACLLAALVLRGLLGGLEIGRYGWMLALILCLTPAAAAMFGLHRTGRLPAHRELQAVFCSVGLTYAVILAIIFLGKTAGDYSRSALAGGWLLSLVVLPAIRGFCRERFCARHWWGEPLVICDHSRCGKNMWRLLRRRPQFGLRPVAMCGLFGDDRDAQLLESMERRFPRAMAMVIISHETDVDESLLAEIRFHFSRVILAPARDMGLMREWFEPYELGSMTGLLVRQRLRSRWRRALKRFLDLALCAPIALAAAIPGLILGLLIRLDSPGPALYRQARIGRDGREIPVFKFRTMVRDGDAVLERHLQENPDAREEWARDRKLRHDPRVTRMGAFLRKTSLDELPQILNVLAGDMSLVGPRPIVREEIPKYGRAFREYARVLPGITGLWQISGRNDTTYGERVNFDLYYVSNWSVWLDLWILLRTPRVVLSGRGAY